MKLVSYNVENFFVRAKPMDGVDYAAHRDVLEAQGKLNGTARTWSRPESDLDGDIA